MGVENYHVIELVGEGSFWKVYKGRHKFTGQTVGMKFIMKDGKSDKDINNLRQDIEIPKKLKHEDITEMLDSFESPQEICVVTEFSQGELFEILEDDKHLPEEQDQAIAKQWVRALHYLHSNRIIHRDMKPQNILIGAGSIVKLCDFGFPRAMSTNTVVLRSIKGTPLYMAPELVREQPYNHTADLWSLGVILYELFVGQPPVYTNSVYAPIRHIVKDPVKYPDNMSSSFKNFLKGLLNKVPQNCLTWPALLEHPLVKETTEELEAREMRSATAAERWCIAALSGEGNKIQTPGALAVSSPGGKVASPASSDDNSGIIFQDDAQSNVPDSQALLWRCCLQSRIIPGILCGLPSATASINSGILLNMGSPGVKVGMEDGDLVKVIVEDLGKYIKILLKAGTGTTIGVLLFRDGIVAFCDSRCTYHYITGLEALSDNSDKFFVISDTSNLYFLSCGARAMNERFVKYLAGVVRACEQGGNLLSVELLAQIAHRFLDTFRIQNPENLLTFGGILIGWLPNKNYQAFKVALAGVNLEDLVLLDGNIRSYMVLGCGSFYAEDILGYLNIHPQMNEYDARRTSQVTGHYANLHSRNSGGSSHVYTFRHGQSFNLQRSHQEIPPCYIHLMYFGLCPDHLLLMRIPTLMAGSFTEFEQQMNSREGVECTSLLVQRNGYNYYHVLCWSPEHANLVFTEIMQLPRVPVLNTRESPPWWFERVLYYLGNRPIYVDVGRYDYDFLREVQDPADAPELFAHQMICYG